MRTKLRAAITRKIDKLINRNGFLSHKQCFWTWPFGHIWHPMGKTSYERTCVFCHKDGVIKGIWDGCWRFDLYSTINPIYNGNNLDALRALCYIGNVNELEEYRWGETCR
ncbi:hypothetical protein LCGC14_0142340 [marine sediment metagenome]|uniref:Uncharacterized protein n=1 Tax=marine sediment metagenome TaxID=412755 RepID=A0A0F9V4S3_9ZZZZ